MARKAANVRERLDSKTGKRTYEKRFTVEGKRYSVYGNTVKECMEKEVAKRKSIEEH